MAEIKNLQLLSLKNDFKINFILDHRIGDKNAEVLREFDNKILENIR